MKEMFSTSKFVFKNDDKAVSVFVLSPSCVDRENVYCRSHCSDMTIRHNVDGQRGLITSSGHGFVTQ